MVETLIVPFKLQQAAVAAMLGVIGGATKAWMRFLKGESELFWFPLHRRAEELHTQAATIPSGASWSDHYGRRARDVDVEHMR